MPTASPLKVLHVYPDFGLLGGIERYIEQVALALQNRSDVIVHVACSAYTPFFHQLKDQGTAVTGIETFPWFKRPFWRIFDIATMVQHWQLVKRLDPDIVHLHIGHWDNGVFLAMGYPVVQTFHGYASLFDLSGTKNPLKRGIKKALQPLLKMYFKRLKALIFVSHSEQTRMQDQGFLPSPNFGEVIYNGISIESFKALQQESSRSELKTLFNLPQNIPCIGYINRLDSNKNPLLFLSIAETILNTPGFEDTHFVLAGDGPLRDTVTAWVNRHPQYAQFHFLGHVHDVPGLLQCLDVVIHPAEREGFGLGLVEAMAMGVPCVAFATGGPQEILGTPELASCLVPLEHPEQLSQQALKFLQLPDHEKASLRQQLQDRAAQFDIEVMLEKLQEVYHRVRTH